MTAPVKVGDRWVLFRVEQRRPVSLDEILPALRRSIASDMVLQMLAKLPRVPFEPTIPDAPDFVLGRIGGVTVTAYDVFNLSDDSSAFQPWHIPDAIEIVPWSDPIAADSVQAQDFINADAILAKAHSMGLLDQPPTERPMEPAARRHPYQRAGMASPSMTGSGVARCPRSPRSSCWLTTSQPTPPNMRPY